MTLIPGIDPKLPLLDAQVETAVKYRRCWGGIGCRLFLSFLSNLSQKTTLWFFFFLLQKLKLVLLIHNYNILGFQYLNKLESNYFLLFVQYI